MDKIKVAIIFTCYNRKVKTENCLKKIFKQIENNQDQFYFYVFCCDDNSTDGTYEMIRSKYPQVYIVRGSGKLFWAKGMACAIEKAEKTDPDFYLMINDDVDFFDNMIEIMFESYKSVNDPMASIVGSTKDSMTGERTYGGLLWNKRAFCEKKLPVMPAKPCAKCDLTNWNCFLLPQAVYKKVGPIDSFYSHSFADYDYSARIRKAGLPIYVAMDYIGNCSRNSFKGTWLDSSLKLVDRLKLMEKPNGLPASSSWHYVRKFYGIGCVYQFLKPYVIELISSLLKYRLKQMYIRAETYLKWRIKMFDRVNKAFVQLYNKINLKKNKVSYGKNLVLNGIPYFRGKHISFGENCKVNSGMKYNSIGGDTKAIFITQGDSVIKIGNHVGISNSALVAHRLITIDDNVMIGGGCKIYDTDFHSLDYEKRMMNPDPDIHAAPVHIKKGAFIGAHSIVLKGVTIGEKSIVGAGSVVTKSIPDGEIWAGNPARYIKKIETIKEN